MRSHDTLNEKTNTQELQAVNKIIVGMVEFLFIEHIRSNWYFAYLYLIMGKKKQCHSCFTKKQNEEPRNKACHTKSGKVGNQCRFFLQTMCSGKKYSKKACPGAPVTSISFFATLC